MPNGIMLANPATYLPLAEFKDQANDLLIDLTQYSDAQLLDFLITASGEADAYMNKSLLAQEKTIRVLGEGTNRLELHQTPVLYVKRVQVIVPGNVGFSIPIDQLLVDYDAGELYEYTPLLWQGVGYGMIFPLDIPIDVTLGYGYGQTAIPALPVTTLTDNAGGSLTPGTYNVAITTRTMWGEVNADPVQFTTSLGSIAVAIKTTLGAYVYRAYLSSAVDNTTITADAAIGDTSLTVAAVAGMTAGTSWLLDSGANAEVVTITATASGSTAPVSALTKAHTSSAKFIPCPVAFAESPQTAYGTMPIAIILNQNAPQDGIYPDLLPTVNTASPVAPQGLKNATRLLSLSRVSEQNNPANRGVYQRRSGARTESYRSTEGTNAKGVPLLVQQALNQLRPYSLQEMY